MAKRKDRKPEYQYHKAALQYEADNEVNPCCKLSQLKFSLYLFNILFFMSGIILVSVGLWTFFEKHPSLTLLTSGLYDVTSCILIFAGIVILVVAVSGFCGLSKDSQSVMLLYSILLFVIFLAEVGAGSLAYLYRQGITDHVGQNLEVIFLEKYGVNNASTIAVDQLQVGLECCGANSYEDWKDSQWWTKEDRGENLVPDSCCITPKEGCGIRDHPSNIRYTGCFDRVAGIAEDHLIVVGAVALSICLLQLIGTLLSCALHCRLRKVLH